MLGADSAAALAIVLGLLTLSGVALLASSSWSHAFLVDHTWRLRPDTEQDRRLYDAMTAHDHAANDARIGQVEHHVDGNAGLLRHVAPARTREVQGLAHQALVGGGIGPQRRADTGRHRLGQLRVGVLPHDRDGVVQRTHAAGQAKLCAIGYPK